MIKDLISGFRMWELWSRLAWNEVQGKYRRSVVGPLWTSLHLLIFVTALGMLYAEIFNRDPRLYIPHLVTGLLVWNFISSIMMEGCQLFGKMRAYIDETNLPLPMFVFALLWRNSILLSFGVPVFMLVAIVLSMVPTVAWLSSVLALFLVLFNALWIVLILAILAARFHDLAEILGTVMRLVFFVTPILWMPGQEGRFTLLLDVNPFYHCIEIFRAPLMGNGVAVESWKFMAIFTVVGWILTSVVYNRFRDRVVFWL
jgi:ABC-type polysaccharide/polyol phosphate export permease